MDKVRVSQRKELAVKLLYALKDIYEQLAVVASDAEKTSGDYFEQAFKEEQENLLSVMDSYHRNVDRIRAIHNEITESINSWYEFIKDEKQTGKITFPIAFYYNKRSLNKKISKLNEEISSITINNRFIKEKLTLLEHQLKVKAVSLAKAGSNYLEYERVLLSQKSITAELEYLLPTIPGVCPADISSSGIDNLMTKLAASIEQYPYSRTAEQ